MVHSEDVENNTNLRNFIVTDLGLINPGDEVKFKIQVTNLGGYSNTSLNFLKVIAADVP